MEYIIIILAIILGLVGIVGAIIPGIPGPPISFVGLLLAYLFCDNEYSVWLLIIFGILAVIITILDYYIPIYGTKKLGGSKYGVRGSTIGMIVSIIVLPILGITIGPFGIVGILLGPFLGAYLGELYAKNNANALKSALGSFVGFLAGTFIKLIYCIVAIVYIFFVCF